MLARIADGRTDLVFDHVDGGGDANATDGHGVALIAHCAYYGDVSAMRFLLAHGASLAVLGDDLGLNAAAFHGHWRLCEFLLERGADANHVLAETGETPLHGALSRANRPGNELAAQVLLEHGADPTRTTHAGVVTGALMRDARTSAETPLHRAAAFASASMIERLVAAGASIDARDAHGDTPLAWASWHQRPDAILRLLCHGAITLAAARDSRADHGAGWGAMDLYLLGRPRRT